MINKTISYYMESNSKEAASDIGFTFPSENKAYSYKEIYDEVNRYAEKLNGIGVKKGSHLAVWGTNTSVLTFVWLAASCIGAVVVPVNVNFKEKELAHILKNADIDFLFCTQGFRQGIQLAIISRLMKEGRIDELQYPLLKRIIIMDGEKDLKTDLWQSFTSLTTNDCDKAEKQLELNVDPDADFVIQFTSGTTALPKGAVLTQFSCINVAQSFGERIHLSAKDRIGIPLPFFHCYGSIAGLLPSILFRVPAVIIDTFSCATTLQAIEKEKCSVLLGVPTMFIMMMSDPEFQIRDVRSVKKIVISGARCPAELANQIYAKFASPKISIGYGMTETSSFVLISDIEADGHKKRIQTIGRKMAGVELRVVNTQTGAEAGVNEMGELLVRSYCLMKGYYHNKEKTDQMIDQAGWLHTADLVSRDEDGFYTFYERGDYLIIRGGENISPAEIENELLKTDGVLNAQVIGVPDKRYGEELAAFILVKDKSNTSGLMADMKERLAGTLTWFKIPKFIVFVTELPCTESGKVKKNVLKKRAIDQPDILIPFR